MSKKMREEAEACTGPETFSDYGQFLIAEDRAKQAKRVLILLDALEKLCEGCEIDCHSSKVVCDYHFIQEAIAKAEQV